ncbi:hypothetical protein BJ138DRAFT_1190751 [Hygrophoropsis aurantiaca]|uniref:Uncharacterized protein n=1 Tax=Hygrophoropsis aurantiaca TaxID=72124 RepID=A0ACB8AB36_9AGAM|nr:hypothetical protein BJ138DRAFT_1190751 [Hygrophoropsis aurantiaca]
MFARGPVYLVIGVSGGCMVIFAAYHTPGGSVKLLGHVNDGQVHVMRTLFVNQDIANKAIQGSTADLQTLNESIIDAGPNASQLSALLPVFILHLDPTLIPHLDKPKYTADELGAIHCARWALKAVGKIFVKTLPEDGDSIVWERMFPWMSFLQTKFLFPDPSRDEHLGISFPDGDIAQTVVQGFSVICCLGRQNLVRVQSTPSMTDLIAALWLFVAHQHIDYSDLQGLHAKKAALQIRGAIMILALPTICTDTPVGFAVLRSNAGTTNRVLTTAVYYIRFIADTVRAIRDPTPDNMALVEVASNALADCVPFIESFDRCDRAHAHALVALGSVRLVTTATRHIARLLLANGHAPGRGLGRAANTPVKKLEYFAKVYKYLHFALLHLGDGVTHTCEALNAGILEVVFHTWLYTLSCYTSPPCPKFVENEAIIVLCQVIPCYFVYPRVLRAFARALSRPAFREAEKLAQHDDDLWGRWKTLRATVREYIQFMEEVDGNRDCDAWTESISDIDAGPGVYQHCAGCLACTYCSKACQRADWKGGHRTGCRVLQDSLGTLTSSSFWRSLPLIGEIEKIEFMQNRSRILDLFEEAFDAHGGMPDHLAIEIDLIY